MPEAVPGGAGGSLIPYVGKQSVLQGLWVALVRACGAAGKNMTMMMMSHDGSGDVQINGRRHRGRLLGLPSPRCVHLKLKGGTLMLHIQRRWLCQSQRTGIAC